MWFKKNRTVRITLPPKEPRLRPETIQEYLSLTPGQRNGVILTSQLVTEICEAIQEKP